MKLFSILICLVFFISHNVLGDDVDGDDNVMKFEKQDTACLRPCPQIYSPVCGSDGVTYANDCELETAACRISKVITVKHSGEC